MLERKRRVLIIDDDSAIHLTTKHNLRDHYACTSAYTIEEAKILVASQSFDVVLLDLNLETPLDGFNLLTSLRANDEELDVIVVSGNTQRDLALQAIDKGAASYLVKNYSPAQLLITIDGVIKRRELQREVQHHQSDKSRALRRTPLVGSSKAIESLQRTIEKIKKSQLNVLITGDTGTGKELVARHIGAGEGAPFVAIDSATITSAMAESTLFGHEKGAFTGALNSAKGLFEEANNGTLYFDEISNMPLEIQVKLLRVIQEKEISRLGSRKIIPLQFRVVCATNRDLEAMAQKNEFKYDLLQRINVIPIKVPTLAERKDDIPELVKHFLGIYAQGNLKFSDSALSALQKYNWPGNIRELSNVIAYVCTMFDGVETVELEDLPSKIRGESFVSLAEASPEASLAISEAASRFVSAIAREDDVDFYSYMNDLEGKVLKALYSKYSGNLSNFSRAVKVSRSHLYAKLNKHGIH